VLRADGDCGGAGVSAGSSGPLASPEITVKLFVENPEAVRLKELVPVFHRWIREDLLPDELPIDVASYAHVPKGPGVMIICDKAQYALDERHGRPGIRYRARRDPARGGEGGLERALGATLLAARLLETDPQLEGRYRFGTGEIEVGIHDRLRAPSAPETFTAVRSAFAATVEELYQGGVRSAEMTSGAREPFTATFLMDVAPSVGELLERLTVPAA